MQVTKHRVRRAGAHVRAGDRIERQRALQAFMVKVLIHDVINIDHDDAHQVLHVGPPHELETEP